MLDPTTTVENFPAFRAAYLAPPSARATMPEERPEPVERTPTPRRRPERRVFTDADREAILDGWLLGLSTTQIAAATRGRHHADAILQYANRIGFHFGRHDTLRTVRPGSAAAEMVDKIGRAPKQHARVTRPLDGWSDDDTRKLVEAFEAGAKRDDLPSLFPQRTAKAVTVHATRIGLRFGRGGADRRTLPGSVAREIARASK